MSMDYIRRTYGVPAKRGARVQYDGVTVGHPPLLGTITSATNSGHIRVRFDGERRTLKLHPTWALVYLKPPNDQHARGATQAECRRVPGSRAAARAASGT